VESAILLLSADARLREAYADGLTREGWRVVEAASLADGLEAQRRRSIDVTIAVVESAAGEGVAFLQALRAIRPLAEVVLVAPPCPAEDAVAAMKCGAGDVLFAPVIPEDLVEAVRALAGGAPALAGERRHWKELRQRFELQHIVAESSAMLHLLTLAARVAPTDATVLITGESGTGKELLARALHLNSGRRRQPMLSINCAAIPETLLESELFGYRRGAFTGAHLDKPGLLAAADGGTLFLDELAELSLATQAKLLRFLQEGTYFPVGSAAPMSADVRVIAATNADLGECVRNGAFRHDLFYRLSVFPLHVPPLRERREDILPLARNFLQRVSDRAGRRPPQIAREVIRFLLSRTWPGNVRELENTVERATILCDGTTLTSRDFRVLDAGHTAHAARLDDLPEQGVDLPELNRRLVAAALERTQYNVSAAARLLGLSRPALRYRMEKYGLRAPTLAA